MTVSELREALKDVPGDTPVAMVDEMSVVFAEVVDGVFVVSDMGPGYDEPVYWDEEESDEFHEDFDGNRIDQFRTGTVTA